MLRCCLGAYGCPDHAWMPCLGAGLIRLSQLLTRVWVLVYLIMHASFAMQHEQQKTELPLQLI